ncbi:GNAT family N-acetyltransferase [Paenibacillus sp. NPDC058071]|uniref:GNAT family N-acetyltransferase n=1 Tax=Paenibacillus sp. NPDC058071 TaxID=3346326 RepID=UPI0036DAF9E5
MGITLQPITLDNWYTCTKLKVKPEQLAVFPAPVVYWIAESKYVEDFELQAIYQKDEVVGFIVFSTKPDEEDRYWIPALMIDEQHQGKGYGRAAMKLLIAYMTSLNFHPLVIGHRPNNEIAGKLYETLGFQKISDDIIDGEIIRLLA